MEKTMANARLLAIEGFSLVDESDQSKVIHLNKQVETRMQAICTELRETIKSKHKRTLQSPGRL